MAYEPRGKVGDLIAAMRAKPKQIEWPRDEVAAIMDIPVSNVAAYIGAARDHGLIFSAKRGRQMAYSLAMMDEEGEGEQQEQGPEPESDDDAPPFNAALWADGELTICGMQVNEDGGVTLSADQTRTLYRLLRGQGMAE